MPELAEVELARRQWSVFEGEKVSSITSHSEARIYRDCPSEDLDQLTGCRLIGSRCHGKRLLFSFGLELHLEVHLGMSGKLFAAKNHEESRHDHLMIHTLKSDLVFNDYRMFGRVLCHQVGDPWAHLPPQPQDSKFSVARVRKLLERHPRKPLKALLLDQSACPGIGNWMADEICWKLGVYPAIPSEELDPSELRRAIRFVSLGALRHVAEKNAGASVAGFAPGSYVDQVPPPNWLFQHRWKKGGSCPRCKSPLERDTIATRTTAWCPTCQPV